VYAVNVTARNAHVVNGRIVVDEPVELPDGADASADQMSAQERAAVELALTRSIAQADEGDLIEADEVLGELQRP
jgi:hypothetical protein